MEQHKLLQLAQDLEWLGCELEYYGHRHAMEGYPEAGLTWEVFLEKQQGVLTTADKVERELKGLIRFNPAALVGMDYPIAEAIDSVTLLLAAVEEIRQAATDAVNELPRKVRKFTGTVATYLNTLGAKKG